MGRRKKSNRRRVVLAAGLGCAAVAGVPALLSAAHGAPAVEQTVAVPAYMYPKSASWDALAVSKQAAGMVVANPDSGPGSGTDTTYQNAIKDATAAGTKVIGYVDTGYFGISGWEAPGTGESSSDAWLQTIEKNVDVWFDSYGSAGLGGIFFDDALNTCGPAAGSTEYVDLYKKIKDYVKSKASDAQVVLNPGTGTAACYEDAADTLVTFEGSYAKYLQFNPQPWEESADPSKIWHLVYETSTSEMANAVSLSKQRNAGYIYVTDDDNTPSSGQEWGNPWDSVTSYWSKEVAAVEKD